MGACGHAYCRDCFVNWFTYADTWATMPALRYECHIREQVCGYEISLKERKAYLAPDAYETILANSASSDIYERPRQNTACPKEGCSQLYNPGRRASHRPSAVLGTGTTTMSSPYYKPGLPAFYNDFDLRHVNGASVVFSAGGEVQCIKLVKDFSAIRMHGLEPNQFNQTTLAAQLMDSETPTTIKVSFRQRHFPIISNTVIVGYNPSLPAELKVIGLRHINGASVIYGSGGRVLSCKLLQDFSAICVDGLGPHQFHAAAIRAILALLGVQRGAMIEPRYDDDTHSQHVVVMMSSSQVTLATTTPYVPLLIYKRRLINGAMSRPEVMELEVSHVHDNKYDAADLPSGRGMSRCEVMERGVCAAENTIRLAGLTSAGFNCTATFDTGDECYAHMRLVPGSYDGVTMIDAGGNPVLDEEEMEEQRA
ncbi:ariadne ring protein [Colletotrichum musicola]|uniref:Ariadne ring protein n=1 Tax=Colletotrichum musicola TaxID=2175873 RepID=A0A8H6NG20_9PEZI|nr:ariadne ring protein [Colletotrichum musicola]